MLLEFVAGSLAAVLRPSECASLSVATRKGSPGPKWFVWYDSTLEVSIVGLSIANTFQP
jgi:hypothetical protein